MITIVWDVDDVLNDLMSAWFHDAFRSHHPDCTVSYEQIAENPPHQMLGIERQEYLDSLDAFRISPRARCLTPHPAILEWMREHGARYRHVALTARPLASAGPAAEWVFGHFGNWIRCFGVVPSRQDESVPFYDRDKADFLGWFREADVFVDDSEANVAAVEKLGVQGVVFPQPWNRRTNTVEDVLRMVTR
jgi:FMN phosphatase YigB (HAD superfamily)